jgi:CHAT domain-containing protein
MAAGLLRPRPATLAEIRAALGPRDALVEYGVFPTGAVALVVVPNAARIVPLASRKALEAACAAMGWEEWEEGSDEALDRLRRIVFDPLGLPADVERVLVSPDGVLWTVPFSMVFRLREVCHVPSATAYLLLKELAKPVGSGVLAIGNPTVGEGLRSRRPQPLPTAAQEARDVGDVRLIEEEATSSRVREALASRPRWRAVHIATHAFRDVERPALSALGLAATEDEEGHWIAFDIARSTWSSDLVVLSDNRTAVGPDLAAEGPLSLARAFLEAGVPRVVASIQGIEDESTLAFMRRLHEARKAGASASAALRDAQAHVRSTARWRRPRHWAPWILLGVPD